MPRSPIRPMDAVAALHAEGDHEVAEAIITALNKVVFGAQSAAPAGLLQHLIARVSYRILQWTTTQRKKSGEGTSVWQNALLQRTGHPYALALLASSSGELEALVEGGDPMIGPYMMIVPEILRAGTTFDRVFLNSVQAKDVQLRFIWETRATYAAAKSRLDSIGKVRMKAVAAGMGLSMIVAYHRLIGDGYDPANITIQISDRDSANTHKTRRMLEKFHRTAPMPMGISTGTEDIFALPAQAPYDVVTAIGILEYFQGHTCHTTEKTHRIHEPDEPTNARHLVAKLGQITAVGGSLIVNTYRPHPSIRILELFGKRFDFRNRENLRELLATASFVNPRLIGSGNIYDVEVYEKV